MKDTDLGDLRKRKEISFRCGEADYSIAIHNKSHKNVIVTEHQILFNRQIIVGVDGIDTLIEYLQLMKKTF
jgi:hypothetical protein